MFLLFSLFYIVVSALIYQLTYPTASFLEYIAITFVLYIIINYILYVKIKKNEDLDGMKNIQNSEKIKVWEENNVNKENENNVNKFDSYIDLPDETSKVKNKKNKKDKKKEKQKTIKTEEYSDQINKQTKTKKDKNNEKKKDGDKKKGKDKDKKEGKEKDNISCDDNPQIKKACEDKWKGYIPEKTLSKLKNIPNELNEKILPPLKSLSENQNNLSQNNLSENQNESKDDENTFLDMYHIQANPDIYTKLKVIKDPSKMKKGKDIDTKNIDSKKMNVISTKMEKINYVLFAMKKYTPEIYEKLTKKFKKEK